MLIVVCEDNPAWLKWIGNTINNYNGKEERNIHEVELFINVEDLLEYSRAHKPDIAYLDIQIGKGNGLDTAKSLEIINKDILIIYISAYDYYYEALQTAPFRFIKKDVTYNEKDVLETLEEAIARKRSGFFTYRFSGRDCMVNLSEVKYIYSQHREIHFSDGKEDIGYFYGKLDEVEKEVGKLDTMLIRINKSTIINMRYVQSKSSRTVEVSGMKFKISTKYMDNFLKNV